MTTLFDPLQLGDIAIQNRVVMAPLTRSRAYGGVPTTTTAQYYAQRASAGLIVAEGAPISAMARGYSDTPGIYSSQQVAAWRKVTDAVHAKGGKIVCQLWHVGRVAHADVLPDGKQPVSSTCRPPKGAKAFTRNGFVDTTPPRQLEDAEIPHIVADYRRAALLARQAGFDGVEIHAANTYLLDQFLRDSINQRTGSYGGSIANRIRFVVEVAEAVTSAIGAGRTGLRISPLMSMAGSSAYDSQPQALFTALLDAINPLGLAYVHVVEGEPGTARQPVRAPKVDYAALRQHANRSAWIANNCYTRTTAMRAVASGYADAVSFGRSFISNPDLVERLRHNLALAPMPQRAVLYGGTEQGYTDYPLANGLPA